VGSSAPATAPAGPGPDPSGGRSYLATICKSAGRL